MIDRNPQRQLARIGGVQTQKARLHGFAHHRAHGVCQDQHLISPGQRGLGHVDHLGVHERFATGKGNLAHGPVACFELVKIVTHLVSGNVDQRIIGRAGVDIAIHAFDVAQRSGVEPERLRIGQRNSCPRLPFGGQGRILEFAHVCRAQIFHASSSRSSFLLCLTSYAILRCKERPCHRQARACEASRNAYGSANIDLSGAVYAPPVRRSGRW